MAIRSLAAIALLIACNSRSAAGPSSALSDVVASIGGRDIHYAEIACNSTLLEKGERPGVGRCLDNEQRHLTERATLILLTTSAKQCGVSLYGPDDESIRRRVRNLAAGVVSMARKQEELATAVLEVRRGGDPAIIYRNRLRRSCTLEEFHVLLADIPTLAAAERLLVASSEEAAMGQLVSRISRQVWIEQVRRCIETKAVARGTPLDNTIVEFSREVHTELRPMVRDSKYVLPTLEVLLERHESRRTIYP